MCTEIPFLGHIALALILIALVSGTWLLSKGLGKDIFCKKVASVLGILIVLLSLASAVCITYRSIRDCMTYKKTDCHKKGEIPFDETHKWVHPPIDDKTENTDKAQ